MFFGGAHTGKGIDLILFDLLPMVIKSGHFRPQTRSFQTS